MSGPYLRYAPLDLAIEFIDSHTEGEPTRLILSGAPGLPGETLAEKATAFQADHAAFRTGTILEPRGHAAIVGCLLLPPVEPGSIASLIFYNNRGALRMCGHGTIGAAATLVQMGKAMPGELIFDTPEGQVTAKVADDGCTVEIGNVVSRRWKEVMVKAAGYGPVTGDIAFGGNWFFLIGDSPVPVEPGNLRQLTDFTEAVRTALLEAQITGEDGGEIDHIEVFGPALAPGADSKSFVLCPGGEYDRSPCGTGTSAKLACLAASGSLAPGETWVQESIIGTTFGGRYEEAEGGIRPFITGRAFVTTSGTLQFHDSDPLRSGFQA